MYNAGLLILLVALLMLLFAVIRVGVDVVLNIHEQIKGSFINPVFFWGAVATVGFLQVWWIFTYLG